MEVPRWITMFAAAIALCGFGNAALAARGQLGGLAGMAGCIEGCMTDSRSTKVTEVECTRYCECSLTIESSRWREEMAPERMARRNRLCMARTWPDRVDPAHGFKRVLICVPQPFRNEQEKNSPEVMNLYKNGTMKIHFDAVDAELTALKADRKSRLFRVADQSRKAVVVFLNDHTTPHKIRDIVSDAQCPPRHWINDYDFEEWLLAPGRKLE